MVESQWLISALLKSFITIHFTFTVIDLPPAILRQTRHLAAETSATVLFKTSRDQTHLYDSVVCNTLLRGPNSNFRNETLHSLLEAIDRSSTNSEPSRLRKNLTTRQVTTYEETRNEQWGQILSLLVLKDDQGAIIVRVVPV
jgi:hypothetical protein